MRTHTITRLYDDGSQPRFADTEVSLGLKLLVPPAEPLAMAALGQATAALLVEASENWRGDAAHPAPARQLMIGLRGVIEITAGQEARRFGPGDVLLMEDTTGAGHRTRVVEGGAVLFVQLA
jgi:hypothetical protein